MHKNSNTKNLMMVAILLISGIAGFLAYQQLNSSEEKQEFMSLLVFPKQKSFSGFNLTDKNNKVIDINTFAGHWTLLFFGYTHCPDVCPMTLSELQKTFKYLENKNLKQLPKVLFISVDSQRDTPQILKEYIQFFNPVFNAATSDDANILSITSQIGAAYHIESHEQNNLNYNVDHTAAVFLINPEKKLYGLFRTPHDAKKIAEDLTQIIGSK
jgi:protein SCO1/2